MPDVTTSRLLGQVRGALEMHESSLTFFQEKPSGHGQLDLSSGSRKEFSADALFQYLDHAAQCGLGDAQYLGGLLEMQGLGDGEEGSYLAEVKTNIHDFQVINVCVNGIRPYNS